MTLPPNIQFQQNYLKKDALGNTQRFDPGLFTADDLREMADHMDFVRGVGTTPSDNETNLKIKLNLQEQVKKLQAFKDWVHARLTEMGVPEDAAPENTAKTGCRVSGRFNYIDVRLVCYRNHLKNIVREFNATAEGIPEGLYTIISRARGEIHVLDP